MSVCPYYGSDMYNIDDGIKCDMCGYIIRSDLSEDFSEIEMDEDYINEFETIRQKLSKIKASKFDIDHFIILNVVIMSLLWRKLIRIY